jgi:hypothetical protein
VIFELSCTRFRVIPLNRSRDMAPSYLGLFAQGSDPALIEIIRFSLSSMSTRKACESVALSGNFRWDCPLTQSQHAFNQLAIPN